MRRRRTLRRTRDFVCRRRRRGRRSPFAIAIFAAVGGTSARTASMSAAYNLDDLYCYGTCARRRRPLRRSVERARRDRAGFRRRLCAKLRRRGRAPRVRPRGRNAGAPPRPPERYRARGPSPSILDRRWTAAGAALRRSPPACVLERVAPLRRRPSVAAGRAPRGGRRLRDARTGRMADAARNFDSVQRPAEGALPWSAHEDRRVRSGASDAPANGGRAPRVSDAPGLGAFGLRRLVRALESRSSGVRRRRGRRSPERELTNVNDPSAGSPTETLLRLLLPLNDKVQWNSRDVAGGEPPTSPRSEHFTGPFNR